MNRSGMEQEVGQEAYDIGYKDGYEDGQKRLGNTFRDKKIHKLRDSLKMISDYLYDKDELHEKEISTLELIIKDALKELFNE